MCSARMVRRMRTLRQQWKKRMDEPTLEDPLSLLGLSEVIRERMQLRVDLLNWVLEEGPWPSEETERQMMYRKLKGPRKRSD